MAYFVRIQFKNQPQIKLHEGLRLKRLAPLRRPSPFFLTCLPTFVEVGRECSDNVNPPVVFLEQPFLHFGMIHSWCIDANTKT